jgi:anti-anti-sigma regulatory factor
LGVSDGLIEDAAMLQMLPTIEDGHLVLHLGGDLDSEGAAAVARLIGQSMGDFAIDFTDVHRVEDSGFTVLSRAMRRCPYKLVVRGLDERPPAGQTASSYR